jgi:hypothetical protein
MQLHIDNNVKFVIWYSGDEDTGQHPKALTEPDGSLRSNGVAFRNFIDLSCPPLPPPPQIATTLYGFNGVMAASARPFSNTSVLNAIGMFEGSTIMRYPGGNVANSFNWVTGKDDDGSGTANTLADIAALHSSGGYDILFVPNMLTKTLQNQLDMLAAANALGIPIKFVELGNEFNNINNPGHAVFPLPQNYADEAEIWRDAIKAIYPDCFVIMIGENRSWSGGEDWNSIILAKNPDGISWHESPNVGQFSNNGIANIAQLDAVIMADFVSKGMSVIKSVPICVTETNYTFDPNNLLTTESQIATTLYMMQKIFALVNQNNMDAKKLLCVRGIEGEKEGALLIRSNSITLQPTGNAMLQFITWVNAQNS